MTTLTGRTPAATYKDLLQVSNSNSGIDATVRAVSDGEGTACPLQLSTSKVNINSGFQIAGADAAALISIEGVSWVQGDIAYWSGADTAVQLAKDANATRYLSNTGTSNNPAWAQVDLSNGVTGTLPASSVSAPGSDMEVILNQSGALGTNGNLKFDYTQPFAALSILGGDNYQSRGALTVNGYDGDDTHAAITAYVNNGAANILDMRSYADSSLAYFDQSGGLNIIGPDGTYTTQDATAASFNLFTGQGKPCVVIRGGTSSGEGALQLRGASDDALYWNFTNTDLYLKDDSVFSVHAGTAGRGGLILLTSREQGFAAYGGTPIAQPNGSVITALSNSGLNWIDSPTISATEITGLDAKSTANTINTNNATQTTLYTFGTNNNTAYRITVEVVGRRTGGSAGTTGDSASYLLTWAVKNIGGTLTAIGGATVTVLDAWEDQPAWDATLDISSISVRVRVTGAVNNNISWKMGMFRAVSV